MGSKLLKTVVRPPVDLVRRIMCPLNLRAGAVLMFPGGAAVIVHGVPFHVSIQKRKIPAAGMSGRILRGSPVIADKITVGVGKIIVLALRQKDRLAGFDGDTTLVNLPA